MNDNHINDNILKKLKVLWSLFPCETSGHWNISSYYQCFNRINKILNPYFQCNSNQNYIHIKNDYQRIIYFHKYLSFNAFIASLYELAELWVKSIDYELFFNELLSRMTEYNSATNTYELLDLDKVLSFNRLSKMEFDMYRLYNKGLHLRNQQIKLRKRDGTKEIYKLQDYENDNIDYQQYLAKYQSKIESLSSNWYLTIDQEQEQDQDATYKEKRNNLYIKDKKIDQPFGLFPLLPSAWSNDTGSYRKKKRATMKKQYIPTKDDEDSDEEIERKMKIEQENKIEANKIDETYQPKTINFKLKDNIFQYDKNISNNKQDFVHDTHTMTYIDHLEHTFYNEKIINEYKNNSIDANVILQYENEYKISSKELLKFDVGGTSIFLNNYSAKYYFWLICAPCNHNKTIKNDITLSLKKQFNLYHITYQSSIKLAQKILLDHQKHFIPNNSLLTQIEKGLIALTQGEMISTSFLTSLLQLSLQQDYIAYNGYIIDEIFGTIDNMMNIKIDHVWPPKYIIHLNSILEEELYQLKINDHCYIYQHFDHHQQQQQQQDNDDDDDDKEEIEQAQDNNKPVQISHNHLNQLLLSSSYDIKKLQQYFHVIKKKIFQFIEQNNAHIISLEKNQPFTSIYQLILNILGSNRHYSKAKIVNDALINKHLNEPLHDQHIAGQENLFMPIQLVANDDSYDDKRHYGAYKSFIDQQNPEEHKFKAYYKYGVYQQYCPVSLLDQHLLMHGNEQNSISYRGLIYHFHTKDKMNKFMNNPLYYISKPPTLPKQYVICIISSDGIGSTTIINELNTYFDQHIWKIYSKKVLKKKVISIEPEDEKKKKKKKKNKMIVVVMMIVMIVVILIIK